MAAYLLKSGGGTIKRKCYHLKNPLSCCESLYRNQTIHIMNVQSIITQRLKENRYIQSNNDVHLLNHHEHRLSI